MPAETRQVKAQPLKLPRGYRRNFWCLAMDFCFFGIGLSFFGPNTVIPSFLTELGASATVIGLLATLQRAGWLMPQLVAARYISDKPYKKPYILLPAGISRSMILVLAGLIFVTRARNPSVLVAMTMVVIAIFWLGDGLASLPWFDVLGKSIPAERRGRLTTVGQILSGIASFAAGFGVEWMLSDRGPVYPTSYALLFVLGFAMLAFSFAALALTKENRGITEARVPSWAEYVPQIGLLLKQDRVFRRFLLARQVFNVAGLATPFYMTYALERLGLPTQVAGRYTSIGVVGTISAAVLFGWLNERRGTKATSAVSVLVTAAIPAMALFVPLVVTDPTWLAWAYGLVFLASNASFASYMPGWTAYLLEWAPEAERPIYVGLTNTINGLTALVSVLGGAILQWTGDNYEALFAITAIGTLAALPVALGLPEPRRTTREATLA